MLWRKRQRWLGIAALVIGAVMSSVQVEADAHDVIGLVRETRRVSGDCMGRDVVAEFSHVLGRVAKNISVGRNAPNVKVQLAFSNFHQIRAENIDVLPLNRSLLGQTNWSVGYAGRNDECTIWQDNLLPKETHEASEISGWCVAAVPPHCSNSIENFAPSEGLVPSPVQTIQVHVRPQIDMGCFSSDSVCRVCGIGGVGSRPRGLSGLFEIQPNKVDTDAGRDDRGKRNSKHPQSPQRHASLGGKVALGGLSFLAGLYYFSRAFNEARSIEAGIGNLLVGIAGILFGLVLCLLEIAGV